MDAGSITVGMRVRYPRTGTTGTVVRIERIDRDTFAELDSTHLLYRTDQLIGFEGPTRERQAREEADLEKVVRERELARNLHADSHYTDEMCDGGG